MDVSDFVMPKWAKFLAVGVVVALLLTLAYCKGQSAGENKVKVEQLSNEIDTLHTVGQANDTAADERLGDARDLQNQAEELKDASSHPSDDRNTRRLRRLCVQLRQQSGGAVNNPACKRFDGEAGTDAAATGVRD